MIKKKKGQNITEYALVIGIVGAALFVMSPFFERATKLVIRQPVDDLGGFGSGLYSGQRIQEIGIEDNVDPNLGPRTPDRTNQSFSSTKTITTANRGERRVDTDEDIAVNSAQERYQRINYDAVYGR
jgi:hypothetical protein